ncbi:MAG: (d)CMP kinase [Bacteroidota bacterium]
MKKIIVAIDGYSACGKSSTARAVAERSGYIYIDTGAMYRAVTLYFLQHYVTPDNPKEVQKALNDIHITFMHNEKTGKSDTWLNGLNVEREIRSMNVSNRVSAVSAIADVRKAMVAQQQKMGKRRGIVMDGRDIGTNVFPDAELKIFMEADIFVRAERRRLELYERGEFAELDDIIANIADRDRQDTSRKENPLVKAPDAFVLDTSRLEFEEQVRVVQVLMAEKLEEIQKSAAALDAKQV